ncbi:MAG: DNA recombination protein RmuC [Propionibacteriaceae bacterium]|nr:DNA recombination protein RmuC [Propionibacteriaceae bacterium]
MTSLILALAALLVGAALGYLTARSGLHAKVVRAEAERDAALQRAAEVTEDRSRMALEFRSMSVDALDRQTRLADEAADQRLAPVNEALRLLQHRLLDVERQRASLAAELRTQVEGVRLSGEAVRKETQALVTALRNPQVRGTWGETSLRRIVEVAGMVEHCHFDTQTTHTTDDGRRLRPDMRVDLADGRAVFVDSKVPLAAVIDACQAETEEDRSAQLRRFLRHVRTHIDQLSAKEYWALDVGSPEFVVLFLGSDEFYRLALEQDPGLHEYAARRRITLAGPGLLIPLLQTISHGWRQSRLAESAAQVSALGRELHSRLATLGAHFDKLGSSLGTAVRSYNSAVGALESRVLVTARRFERLQVATDELPQPRAVEEGVRQPVASELVSQSVSEHNGTP